MFRDADAAGAKSVHGWQVPQLFNWWAAVIGYSCCCLHHLCCPQTERWWVVAGKSGMSPGLVLTWWWFGSVEREYVMSGGGRRYRHPSTRPTWAGDQESRATQRRGRVQREGPQRSKGIGHMERRGARSNAGRIQDDTNNPQNHNHNAAPNRRRQERGQMKNWKKNKTKVKINRSQPCKSDYKKKNKKG